MPETSPHRDRRLKGVAVAVGALMLTGGGLTAYGLSQQETRLPPPAALSEGGHAGHGKPSSDSSSAGSVSSDPTTSPRTPGSSSSTSGSGHAGHPGMGSSSPSSSSTSSGPRSGAAQGARRGETMPRSRPTSVTIPALGVKSSIIDLGLQPDKSMEVPQDAKSTGWFTGSPTPGELGPSVLAAHVTWDKAPAVFFELGSMRSGQKIEVGRADGSTAVFKVTDVGQYPKAKFPTDDVYGEVDHAALRLITCGGRFDGETGHHVDNVVVYAELIDER